MSRPWFGRYLLPAVFFALTPAMVVPGGGEKPAGRKDVYGDPLPERAVSRLGTTRLIHHNSVTATAFSADGRCFASAAIDGSVLVCEWPSGKRLHAFTIPDHTIQKALNTAIRLSPDGEHLAVWHGREDLVVWHLASGEKVLARRSALAPAFSPDGKRVAWLDGEGAVHTYDLSAKKDLASRARDGRVLALGFTAKGNLLAAEHDAEKVSLVDLSTDKRLRSVDESSPPGWADLSADGRRLAYQVKGGDLTVVDVGNGEVLRSALPDGFYPLTLGTGAGTILLHSRKDGTLRLWGLEGGKPVCTFDTRTGDGGKRVGAFSPDGKLLATGGPNHPHAAGFWDTTTGKPVEVFTGHRAAIYAAAFSPDGRELATCGALFGDPMVRIWAPATGRLLRSVDAHCYGTYDVAYTPDGKQLATCGLHTDEDVCVWDAVKLTKGLTLKGHLYGAGRVAVSPDGTLLASLGAAPLDDAVVWNLRTGKPLHRHAGLGNVPAYVAFTADGRTLVVADFERVRVWEFGGAARDVVKGAGERIALSPDGQVIACPGGGQPVLLLVETLTGKEVCRIACAPKAVAVAFAPDGRTVGLGYADGTIRLFDWPAGRERLSFKAHPEHAHCLAFSPDGKRLTSVGNGVESAIVLVWDVADATNRPVARQKAGPKEIDAWVHALSGADPAVAYRAVWGLVSAPEQSLARLKTVLPAKDGPDRKRIAQWIAELDDLSFKVREKATTGLMESGAAVAGPVEAALRTNPPLEARRRLEQILAAVGKGAVSPERLFAGRAVMVLEQIGGAAARSVLREWAGGDEEAWLTRAARAALRR